MAPIKDILTYHIERVWIKLTFWGHTKHDKGVHSTNISRKLKQNALKAKYQRDYTLKDFQTRTYEKVPNFGKKREV